MICYDIWKMEKAEKEREMENAILEIRKMEQLEKERQDLLKMQQEEEINDFLVESETKDHNPILVRVFFHDL